MISLSDEQSEEAAVKIGLDIERIAKILSLVATPIVLAVFGWIIQDACRAELEPGYVKLQYLSLRSRNHQKFLPGCVIGQ